MEAVKQALKKETLQAELNTLRAEKADAEQEISARTCAGSRKRTAWI